jgi:hypothetical protein
VTYGTRIPSEVRVSAVPKSSGKSKKRREHMKMETEIRVLQPQFKELSSCQLPPATSHQKLGERHGMDSPSGPPEETNLGQLTLGFLTP